jgi:hypothetical protein
MKNKIVGIVVLMLVATTVVSATNNINVKENIRMTASEIVSNCDNKIKTYEPTLFDWWTVDQKQTHQDGSGFTIQPPFTFAQGFTPTKDKLTAVSLYMFNYYHDPAVPVLITVSIRDSLNGSDIATKTIDTSVVTIKVGGTWVLFDFEDISITPGSQYFIVCSGNAGGDNDSYCWFFAYNDRYTQGEGWVKQNATADWITINQWDSASFPEPDFCFKTYFQKPLDISVPINNEVIIPVSYNIAFLPFWGHLFERFPHAFPILRNLFGG